MIKFSDHQNDILSLSEVSKILRSSLDQRDYFVLSDVELAFKALSNFNFKKLTSDQLSVEFYARKVLGTTRLLKNVEYPIRIFIALYLNVNSRLLQIKNKLEAEAKGHLEEIEVLLDHYHSLPFIIRYRSEPTTPRNNEERKILEFYKRTVAKREQIISYLLYGIFDRALKKAEPVIRMSEWSESIKDVMLEMERAEDLPYLELSFGIRFHHDLNMERLDYRKINPLINKYNWFSAENHYRNGYTDEIDQEFEKGIDPGPFFEEIMTMLNGLPVISERREMFREMHFLFSEKKWYALYALALPQIEGVFTEMQDMIVKKKMGNSLSDKVRNVRAAYEKAHYTFDYYEYTLADLRNHFAHTGKVTDAKKQCYRLLADLWYLLDICFKLDTPLSKLSNIIKDGSAPIKHIGHLSEFLDHLVRIEKDGKFPSIKEPTEKFVYQIICKDIKLGKLIRQLDKDFEKASDQFNHNMAGLMHTLGHGVTVNILTDPIKVLKPLISIITTAFEKLPFLVEYDLKLLIDTNSFMHYFPKYFSKLPKNIIKAIDTFKAKHIVVLKNLNFLTDQVKLPVPEDYLLPNRDFEHYIK